MTDRKTRARELALEALKDLINLEGYTEQEVIEECCPIESAISRAVNDFADEAAKICGSLDEMEDGLLLHEVVATILKLKAAYGGREMSEPMDLEQAKGIIAKHQREYTEWAKQTRHGLDYSQPPDDSGSNEAKGFIEGILSERRRLIERFRPVVEALIASDRLNHGPSYEVADEIAVKRFKALALFQEIEKEI